MTAVRSIELTLDADLEGSVRADWDRLAAADLPSLADHTAESNRPHITLAVGTGLVVDEEVIAALASPPLAVAAGGPLLFSSARGRYVLTWSVIVTAELLALHHRLHAALGPDAGVVPVTAPGSWTPHLTLARRLTAEQIPRALDLLDSPARGTTRAARLWDPATATVHPL